MAKVVRGKTDVHIEQLAHALGVYEILHPAAQVDIYRQNSVSIRIRIVDPDFSGISRGGRHDLIWGFIDALPDRTLTEVSLLLLLTPDEVPTSFANLEFDNPIPSRL